VKNSLTNTTALSQMVRQHKCPGYQLTLKRQNLHSYALPREKPWNLTPTSYGQ
jgi:hypothetical protein